MVQLSATKFIPWWCPGKSACIIISTSLGTRPLHGEEGSVNALTFELFQARMLTWPIRIINYKWYHENDPWTQQFNPIPNLKSIDPLEVTFKKCMPLLESRISTTVPSTNTQTGMHHNEVTKHNSMTGTFNRFSFQHARIGLFISGLVLGLVLARDWHLFSLPWTIVYRSYITFTYLQTMISVDVQTRICYVNLLCRMASRPMYLGTCTCMDE